MPVTRPPRHRVASIFNFRVKDGCAARFMAEIEKAQDDSEDEPGLLRFFLCFGCLIARLLMTDIPCRAHRFYRSISMPRR